MLERFAAVAVFASLTLTGCVATESAVAPRGIPVSTPPPAPRLEAQRPPPPTAVSVWIEGYWHWTGMQYAWIPGHWDESAPAGTQWTAPRYTSADGAYFYEAGAWKPAATANAFH